MQLLAITCEMSDGATRGIAVVMPDDSSGSQIYAEVSRKLRERFHVAESVRDYRVTNRWPTEMRAFS